MNIKILLADDHQILRQGLRALLESQPNMTVVGEAGDGRTAVRLVAEVDPDVVVMDVRMPDLNGIEATRQALAQKPEVRVIGLSASSDQDMVVQMLRAGAKGYVLKAAAFEELVTAVQTVMRNEIYLSPVVAGLVVADVVGSDGRSNAFSALSPREREVLQLIAEGKATKQIASHLHVSVKTVETHRRNMMEKLKMDGVADLTKYAIRQGLIGL